MEKEFRKEGFGMISSRKNYLSLNDFMDLAAGFKQDSAAFSRKTQKLNSENPILRLVEILKELVESLARFEKDHVVRLINLKENI